MHRMNEKGESLRDRVSPPLLPLRFLSLSFSRSFLSFFFFNVPRVHSVWLRISIESRWWMAIGIKLCGAPALMLRNIWKLGKFDLRSGGATAAPNGAYIPFTYDRTHYLRLCRAMVVAVGDLYMKILTVLCVLCTPIQRSGCSVLIKTRKTF